MIFVGGFLMALLELYSSLFSSRAVPMASVDFNADAAAFPGTSYRRVPKPQHRSDTE